MNHFTSSFCKEYCFDPISNSDDVNVVLEYLINSLQCAILKITDTIKLSRKDRIMKPWIIPGLVRCVRHRDKRYHKCKLEPENVVISISFKIKRAYSNNVERKN